MRISSRLIYTLPIGIIVIMIFARGILISDLPLVPRVLRSLLSSSLAIAFYCLIIVAIRRYLPEIFATRLKTNVKTADSVGQRVDVTVGSEGKRSWIKWKQSGTQYKSPAAAPSSSVDPKILHDVPSSNAQKQQSSTIVANHPTAFPDSVLDNTLKDELARISVENPKHAVGILRNLVADDTSLGLQKR